MICKRKSLSGVKRFFDPYLDRSGYIRLDRNEDPVGWNTSHFKLWLDSLSKHDLSAYADSTQLRKKISDWLKVTSNQVYITAGSDAAIKNIFESYVNPGDTVIFQEPNWRMYEVYSDIYGSKPVRIQYQRNLNFDENVLIEKIRSLPVRMVVLANPNQPTGTLLESEIINEIICEADKYDSLVVMDEAYYLFTLSTALEYVHNHKNVIIVRTFSKAFGLAGLRIGYCIADSDRINDLMLLRPVTDANSLALKAAEYSLDNMGWILEKIEDFKAGRDWLYNMMKQTGIKTFESHTNFLLIGCKSQMHAAEAITSIRKKGFLLKGPYSFHPLENFIRVTVGTHELMKKFWSECGEYLKTASCSE